MPHNDCPCGADGLCPHHGNPVVIARHLVASGRYDVVRDACRSRQGSARPGGRRSARTNHAGEWPAVLTREAFGSRRALGPGLVRKLVELVLAEAARGPLLDASQRVAPTEARAYPIGPAKVRAFAAAVRELLNGVRDGDETIAHAHKCALARRETHLSPDDRRALMRARVEAQEPRDAAESALFTDLVAAFAAFCESDAANDLSDEQRSDLVDAVVSLCVAMEPTRVEVMRIDAALRSALPADVSLAPTGTPPRGFPRAGNPASALSEEKAA